jgi:LytS/YehU family sensor histidine kinase
VPYAHGVEDLSPSESNSRSLRWPVTSARMAGLVGGIVGLVVGLVAHWQTAWFAVFELGIPCLILGGLAGLVTGAIADVVNWPMPPKR